MATIVLTDAKIYLDKFDISGDMNNVVAMVSADAQEDTAFGATFHTSKPGLRRGTIHGEGFVQFGSGVTTVDGRLYTNVGIADLPISVALEPGGDAGEKAVFMKAMEGAYNIGASVGELLKFQFDTMASGTDVQLVKGTIFEDGKTSRTTAGNTATRTLGAVTSTQKVYAVLHLLAFSGTNVTFTLKSAVTDFATVTTRATFTTATGTTSQYITPVAGAITDTFWRFEWTGTFTSFSAVLIAGIQ